ncbi:tRNA (guanosine(37)-N1)-methyltransferase TrmD [Marispirochaeta aestuarii]|uniref:tRNA (guanine-N(1)-)-methyltransferase n=1 Tax=Marispirochaeta aestuarii TaxID=1963862 RepID=A0A1Y1RU66_9SPIO|nr:tRNA (guanosine(37)-N1)-methyltransferase TrmD [Marispirochaeta aestuarii]ORC31868.1 tRNA (guanosine(37)-N1)-methyltransferase TrmD [Marispirochaeta aestuarii]
MKVSILTLFPEILEGYFSSSIMAKAVDRGLFSYRLINFREFAFDRHRTCDDAPYGGGAGMVLKPEPVAKALDSVGIAGKRVIYPSPSGRLFRQSMAEEFSREEELVIICGRYEGLDQRIIDRYVDDEVCVGDYVLSSGEVAAMVITDAVYRLREGIISAESLEEESFSDGLLEYPHYTRPEVFEGEKVPEILLSGHHEKIREWRMRQRLAKTLRNRPDLLENRNLDDGEKRLLEELREKQEIREERTHEYH